MLKTFIRFEFHIYIKFLIDKKTRFLKVWRPAGARHFDWRTHDFRLDQVPGTFDGQEEVGLVII